MSLKVKGIDRPICSLKKTKRVDGCWPENPAWLTFILNMHKHTLTQVRSAELTYQKKYQYHHQRLTSVISKSAEMMTVLANYIPTQTTWLLLSSESVTYLWESHVTVPLMNYHVLFSSIFFCAKLSSSFLRQTSGETLETYVCLMSVFVPPPHLSTLVTTSEDSC